MAAAVIARLAVSSGDWRWHVCEMNTAHMGQRLRNIFFEQNGQFCLILFKKEEEN
jgi:hypothetical protein